ncbi:alpha/beta hydrolase [Terasakiella pusilla]|uniref:alpha/beta hydrolase n=1 Tax=Terasakiella pusilla TaxID=64973 RepID=UPI003AA86C67
MKTLSGPSALPENQAIESLVVMLHGFGADGQDLIGLAPFFKQHLPKTAFHSPDGPQPCELSPLGRQWFSLQHTDPDMMRRRAETQETAFEGMYEAAKGVAPLIQSYIEDLRRHYNLPADKVCLLGFSQGTMMALHVGLRQTEPFAGIVGFSGALVGKSKLPDDLTSACPVLLIHGEGDEMLPVHAVDLAEEGLSNAGVSVEVMRRPYLPHSIDAEGATAAAEFIQARFRQA